MSVEVPHLRYVVAAAEYRSFRRAATALNITQPTLSKRIRELEDRLGVLLFERSTGGAQLTPEGENIVVRAKRVLVELEGMENSANASKAGNGGRLAIGFHTFLGGPLRDTLSAFGRKFAQVDVNFIEDSRSTLIPLLDRGAIDVVVVLGDVAHRDYACMGLWSERILVVFPKTHALAEHEFVYWTDLKNERFMVSQGGPGPELQEILLMKLSSPGNRPLIKKVNIHHSLMTSMVEDECGVTLICESASANPPPGAVFREVRDGNGPTRLGFVAYWRGNNHNPALKQFLISLQAHSAVPPRISLTN